MLSLVKFFGEGAKSETSHIFDACNDALTRLGVDYLDLFFCHRPDPETPIEESVAAMSDLVRQGKILYWGTSEWSSEDINKAYDIAIKNYLVPPTMEQPEYNIFHRTRVEKEYKELYKNRLRYNYLSSAI